MHTITQSTAGERMMLYEACRGDCIEGCDNPLLSLHKLSPPRFRYHKPSPKLHQWSGLQVRAKGKDGKRMHIAGLINFEETVSVTKVLISRSKVKITGGGLIPDQLLGGIIAQVWMVARGGCLCCSAVSCLVMMTAHHPLFVRWQQHSRN